MQGGLIREMKYSNHLGTFLGVILHGDSDPDLMRMEQVLKKSNRVLLFLKVFFNTS